LQGRKQIFFQMESVLAKTAPIAPLTTTPLIDSYSVHVKDFVPNYQGKDNLSSIELSS
jgi:hypothetical protein